MPDTLRTSRGDVTFVIVGSSSQTSVASGPESPRSSAASHPPEGLWPWALAVLLFVWIPC